MRSHVTGFSCAAAALVLAAATPTRAQPIPTPDHVVIVIEENRSYNGIIGNAAAPYINGLVSQGALLTNSFGITHPSQPDYLALFSGSTQGVTSDATPTNVPFSTPNLGAQLISAGRTFVGYSEGLPSVGFTGNSAGVGTTGYQRKHNPWVNWQQTGTGAPPPNQLAPTTNQPYTAFPTDYSTLPTLSFVIPTQTNDMHAPEGTIAAGDAWLANNLDGYVQWAKTHNSLFLLTWDEDDLTSGNRIPTIMVGGIVRASVTSNQLIDHYGMLATLEDMFGLGRIANSAGQTPMNGIWVQPVPEPSTLVLAAIGGLGLVLRLRRSAGKRDQTSPENLPA